MEWGGVQNWTLFWGGGMVGGLSKFSVFLGLEPSVELIVFFFIFFFILCFNRSISAVHQFSAILK